MKKLYLVLFILLNFSICYCQNDTIFVTGDIPILKVKANEPFVLKFLACHDCGYSWSLEKADSSYVKLISLSSRNTSGRNDIEGGNVYEFWRFTVVSAGTYVLEFIYKRPWLKEVEKVFSVELHVN